MINKKDVSPRCAFVFLSVSWAKKLDALTRVSTSDPEGYLAHPVNAYKLMKRLNTEWSKLETLVLQNPSDGKEVQNDHHGMMFRLRTRQPVFILKQNSSAST